MIKIKNLCKGYKEKKIYSTLNLEIKEHAVTCIMGPSGCGKTTLLRLLTGLESYESGEISRGDIQRISYVFQEDRLMPWLSVEGNIKYVISDLSNEEQEEKLWWSLNLLRLEAEKTSKVGTLSGGMKRRVAIARALVYDYDLLVLDEPFKGLDDQLKWEILEKLLCIWKKEAATVLIVSHDQSLCQKIENIIEIKKFM